MTDDANGQTLEIRRIEIQNVKDGVADRFLAHGTFFLLLERKSLLPVGVFWKNGRIFGYCFRIETWIRGKGGKSNANRGYCNEAALVDVSWCCVLTCSL